MSYVFAHCDNTSMRDDGLPITVKRGEARHADDPVVKAHPELFGDDPVIIARFPGWTPPADDVEQATAAPGERRSTRRAG